MHATLAGIAVRPVGKLRRLVIVGTGVSYFNA
jgi:hypothetical protein